MRSAASGRGPSSSSPRAPASTASGSCRSTLEPLGAVEAYGSDRAFVRISLAGSNGGARDSLADALEAAGHPVIRIELADPIDLGAEFVRWEVATAIAGAVLGIDPFDQPNVEEAKQLTRDLLESTGDRRARTVRATSNRSPAATGSRSTATRRSGSPRVAATSPGSWPATSPGAAPTPTSASRRSSPRRAARDEAFARIRTLLRDRTRRATTAGYGPRFLHSTGQLHKGGAPIGWFLQLTADHPADVDIPGWPYTFGQLIDAQAAGDFGAIESHDLPILRVHLGADPDAGPGGPRTGARRCPRRTEA